MVRKPIADPSPTKNYHHGDLRRALLDATLNLVKDHGPQGFTLRAAARAVGVTPAATYHHFADKDALLAAVAEEGFDMLRAVLEEAAAPDASPQERSRTVGVAYVRFAFDNPTRFRIMVGYGVKQRLTASAMAAFKIVRDVLIAGIRVSPDEVISFPEVLGWWAVVHGLAFLVIDGHLASGRTPFKHTETLVRQAIQAVEERGARRLEAGLTATGELAGPIEKRKTPLRKARR